MLSAWVRCYGICFRPARSWGAPANFAYHFDTLGARVGAHADVITRVGDDDHGRGILRRFHEMRLGTPTVQVDKVASTGTAHVKLSDNGDVDFTIKGNVAWDFLATTDEGLAAVGRADAICFGTLAQRSATSRNTIQQLVAAAPRNTLRIFDINLRQPFYSRRVIEDSLRLANVLKLNDEELPIVAEMFSSRGADTPSACSERGDAPSQKQNPNCTRSRPRPSKARSRASPRHSTFNWSLDLEEQTAVCSIKRAKNVGPTTGRFSLRLSTPWVLETPSPLHWFWGCFEKWTSTKSTRLRMRLREYAAPQSGATPQLPLEFAERFSGSQ